MPIGKGYEREPVVKHLPAHQLSFLCDYLPPTGRPPHLSKTWLMDHNLRFPSKPDNTLRDFDIYAELVGEGQGYPTSCHVRDSPAQRRIVPQATRLSSILSGSQGAENPDSNGLDLEPDSILCAAQSALCAASTHTARIGGGLHSILFGNTPRAIHRFKNQVPDGSAAWYWSHLFNTPYRSVLDVLSTDLVSSMERVAT